MLITYEIEKIDYDCVRSKCMTKRTYPNKLHRPQVNVNVNVAMTHRDCRE